MFTLPYLVNTLGVEGFGQVSFATAFMSYFVVFTNFGFDLSATRAISVNKHRNDVLRSIYSSVFIVKFLLLFASFFILLLAITTVPKLNGEFSFYITAFLIVIGNVLFPVWFFQGIEEMKYITWLNISTRTIITISIFVFVQNPSDYHLALFINTLSYVVPGLIGFVFVRMKYKMKFVLPSMAEIIDTVKGGWHIFVSSFLGSIIASSSIFILGLTSSKEIVGIYSAIEKIIRAIIGFFSPLTQALFPHISAKFAISYQEGLNIVKKAGKLILAFAGIVAIVALVLSNFVINLLYDDVIAEYTYIMQILIIWFFVSILNNIIGFQYLVASGQEKKYSYSFVIAAGVTLLLYVTLAGPFSINGIVAAMLIGETVLTLTMIYSIYKKPFLQKGEEI